MARPFVGRVMRLVEGAITPRPFTASEVAARISEPRAAVWRALRTLLDDGVVEKYGTKREPGGAEADLYVTTALHEAEVTPTRGEVARLDLTDSVFDRLTVLGRADAGPGHGRLWRCECSCGAIVTRRTGSLTRDTGHSCGCRARERRVKPPRTFEPASGVRRPELRALRIVAELGRVTPSAARAALDRTPTQVWRLLTMLHRRRLVRRVRRAKRGRTGHQAAYALAPRGRVALVARLRREGEENGILVRRSLRRVIRAIECGIDLVEREEQGP